MSFFNNPLKKGQKGQKAAANQAPQAANPPTQQPNNQQTAQQQPVQPGGAPGPSLQHVQAGTVSLISYTPEESLQQVQEARERIAFGQSNIMKFMARYSDVWSLIGPLLYAVGTVTEIFIVLWSHQKDTTDYVAGMAIVIVSLIVEGGLLAISFSAKLARNRAEKHGGMTRHEKKKMHTKTVLWYFLSACVVVTQVGFIVSTTNGDGLGGTSGIIALAVARAVAAVVADFYTAFVSEEEPNDGDTAIAIQEEVTEFTSKMLEQKRVEVETINKGAIQVQEAAQAAMVQQERTSQKAAMELDRLKTEQELARLENEAKIARAKAQHQNDESLIRLQIASMEATQLVLMEAVKGIGAGRNDKTTEPLRVVRIQEEDA